MDKYSSSFKTPRDILDTALAREKDACEFYNEALKHTNNELMRDLLERLKDAEYGHVRMVENMIAKIQSG